LIEEKLHTSLFHCKLFDMRWIFVSKGIIIIYSFLDNPTPTTLREVQILLSMPVWLATDASPVVVDCDNSNPSRPVVSSGERCDRAASLYPSLITQKNADLEAGAIPYRLKTMAMLCMSWPL
jgi:uncharacterized membrane protein